MSQALRKSNLQALAKSYFLVTTVSLIAATFLFAMLRLTYESDKNASAKENAEDEQKSLLKQDKEEKSSSSA